MVDLQVYDKSKAAMQEVLLRVEAGSYFGEDMILSHLTFRDLEPAVSLAYRVPPAPRRPIAALETSTEHTCTPACIVIVYGKHQPLQWKSGSVHRYTGCCSNPQMSALLIAFRTAPR